MDNPSSHSSTYGPLTSAALELICQKLRLDKAGWSGPEIVAENDDYKLDWNRGEDEQITLYADGIAQYYKDGGVEGEITITPLHDKGWLALLNPKKVEAVIGLFAVDFFRQLKGLGT